jgi:hypothetical protein
MTETERIGEVLEAATTGFTAQSYELYQPPPLGSLVKTRDADYELYGIVYNAATTSLEPGRRPIARGKDEATEEDIYSKSPQLLKLLKSEFSALVVGHRQGDETRHYLPPRPARIHGFVYLCPPQEVEEFSRSFGFLNIMTGASLPLPMEELIAACLRQMSQVRENKHDFLVAAGRELATRLSGDLNCLKAILERIKP